MKKWVLLCVVMPLLLVPIACTSPQAAETEPEPFMPGAAPDVTPPGSPQIEIYSPSQTEISTPVITVSGHLSFVKDVKLMFGTSGQVAQVNVSELDSVTKGQELARLDTTSLEQTVKTAEIALKSAESDRELAEDGIETAQNNVEAAEIALEQYRDSLREITYPYNYQTVYIDVPTAVGLINDAMNEITKAEAALESGASGEVSHQLGLALEDLQKSYGVLYRRGSGTDVFGSGHLSMDQYWTLRAAEFQVDIAQVAVSSANVALESARTAFDKAQIAVDKASNDLDIAKYQLQRAIITAPFDGVVAAVNVKELDTLTATNYATTIAIEMIDPSRMKLNVEMNELDVLNVVLGQDVTVSVNALADAQFDGKVTSIDTMPVGDSSLVSYDIEVAFDLPQNSALKSGMSATADFHVDES